MQKNISSSFIYLSIAFVEGATVMACELLGAKMTAPFFGTTLYSWAGVLAITLGGLAFGYYLGGFLSVRIKADKLLQIILLSSGLFMVIMPTLAEKIMVSVISLSLTTGLLISLTIFLLPPIILFGMVSPVIVSALVDKVQNSGKITGKVYAISTVGGVLSTLLLGFYIIPNFGIHWPSVFFGILLLVVAFLFVITRRRVIKLLILFLITTLAVKLQADRNDNRNNYIFDILNSSEGLLGQIKIADYSVKTENFGVLPVRGLLVNNTWQTVMNLNDGIALLDYIYFIRPILTGLPKNSNVLLVGLGGGSLCSEIQRYGHNVDVVELDPRLPILAKKYFGLNPKTNIKTDDGRHFIRTNKKKYNLVVLDVFLGENQPWHLLTLESFEKIKNTALNPDGKLIIEFNGFLKGESGSASRSLYATLKAAGFYVNVFATDSVDGIERNFIFLAGITPNDFSKFDYSGVKYTDKKIENLADWQINGEEFRKDSYQILSDELPALETMLLQPAIEWRKELNVHFRDKFVALGQPLFY